MCNLTTRCNECQDWSSDFMSEYLKHKKSLATKRGKKPAFAAASASSQPAVASSPLLGSPPKLPSFSDADRLRDAVLSVLQNLSQSSSVGNNPFSFPAPSPVPDYTPLERGVTRGDGGPQPHNVGGQNRSSGVGACKYPTSVATTPIVHSHLHASMSVIDRPAQVIASDHDVHAFAPLGINPSPLDSSGLDQLQVSGGGNLGSSAHSAISPTSLLFPIPDSGFSSLPGSSSSSVSSTSIPAFSSVFLLFLFLPFFTPSSLSTASFPSSSYATSALPPSVSSLLSSSSSALPFRPSSSAAPFPPASSSVPLSVLPPPGFPFFSSPSSSSACSFLPPPPPSSSSFVHPPVSSESLSFPRFPLLLTPLSLRPLLG